MTWHLVTTDYPPMDGGVASWAEGTAQALRAAGDEVRVYTPRRVAATGTTRLWGRSWQDWGHVWVAAQVLPRVRSGDRVLCATWPLAAGLVGRVDLSVVFHGSDLTRPPANVRLGSALDRLKASARLFPVSRFLQGLLASGPAGLAHLESGRSGAAGAPGPMGQRVAVLPMPVGPVQGLGGRAQRGDDLLTIARLGSLKGVDRVIRLAAREGRGVTVVGDGPDRPALERLASELGVRARFTGRLARREIPWDGHHAALLLSRLDVDGSGAEGFGLVLIEAAARGIPTFGSPIGGLPEAAMHTLADPDHDGLPMLSPDAGDEAVEFVRARHGPERTVRVLRG